MDELKDICRMKQTLTEWCKAELDKGKECVDTKEMGEVIDMIKDLAEAEEKCVKAAYYHTVTAAMTGDEESERMGYDHWRTSSGRYAPKGTGHWTPIRGRSGYPMPAEGDWRPEYGPWGDQDAYNQMMGGSSDGSRGSRSGSMDGGRMGYTDPDYDRIMHDERHGRPYRQWQLSKRHYTETKSEGDKQEMSEHAKEHMADTVMTIKEIWMSADPDLRTKMKNDLTTLMADMK